VTDQQTGQKIQIVTALEPSSPGKQHQYILANADYSSGGKLILAKQESSPNKITPNKVILSGHEGSGVNQVLFASSDLLSQQIQVLDVFIYHKMSMMLAYAVTSCISHAYLLY